MNRKIKYTVKEDGIIRKKRCEICELPNELIECEGCHCFFHFSCVKKNLEAIDTPVTREGGMKKKKGKGQPKLDLESHIVDTEESLENEGLQTPLVGTENLDFKCNNCQKYEVPICFVCRSNVSPETGSEPRNICQVSDCPRYYHLECLKNWPQTQFSPNFVGRPSTSKKVMEVPLKVVSCPRHVCHTCVRDDPEGIPITSVMKNKLSVCVRCPATYNSSIKCLPAGTEILDESHIICPRHRGNKADKKQRHMNAGWCFICTEGGTLICCDYCPAAYHAKCVKIAAPHELNSEIMFILNTFLTTALNVEHAFPLQESSYMCKICKCGRLPQYNDLVWTKKGDFRWWPGQILHPSKVPENIMALNHWRGDFVVRFFGGNEHDWKNGRNVLPFNEDDIPHIRKHSQQKVNQGVDGGFEKAIQDAKMALNKLKKPKPPPYIKIKINKPIGKKIKLEGVCCVEDCNCDPTDVDPCGPQSRCHNRLLFYECSNTTCRAGARCNNRAFQKRQYPNLEPFLTSNRGWGLRTKQFIAKGQFVIETVGEVIDATEFQRRMRRHLEHRDENYYFSTLDQQRTIDARFKGNLARFMNHSCEPNCYFEKWTVLGDLRVGMFALCDIPELCDVPENTELTFNYKFNNNMRCLCGAESCSGYMTKD